MIGVVPGLKTGKDYRMTMSILLSGVQPFRCSNTRRSPEIYGSTSTASESQFFQYRRPILGIAALKAIPDAGEGTHHEDEIFWVRAGIRAHLEER
jgi:hypothetical protein